MANEPRASEMLCPVPSRSLALAALFVFAGVTVQVCLGNEPNNAPLLFAPSNNAKPISAPSDSANLAAAIERSATASNATRDGNTVRFAKSRWVTDKTTTAAPGSSSAGALKWRSRQSVPDVQSSIAAERRTAGSWQSRNGRLRLPVRMVAHEQSGDPFDDPFEDRLAQNEQPGRTVPSSGEAMPDRNSIFQPVEDEPAADAPPELPDLPSFPDNTERPKSPGTSGNGAAVPLDDLPMGTTGSEEDPAAPAFPDYELPPPRSGPLGDLPRTDLSDPTAPSMGPPAEGDDPSCERVYNGRNCCVEDQKCRSAQTALREDLITKISLDITAPFAPGAQTVEEEIKKREERLRKMEKEEGPRKWRNRAGQVVAEGLLTDVRNRRVIIADEAGNVESIPLSDLSQDDWCFLAAWWEVPTECSLGDDQFAPRIWDPITLTWKASALCHKTLYFEEVQLERYGHTTGPIFQPVLSGAHFFLNIAVLPYKMGIHPPTECRYPVGYYRPGSCAPWLLPPVPVSLRGGLLQAGAVVGGVALFP